ncbi:MAG: PIN domain-containing protein, partial [Actinomycetota bacterium]|nr:PIN domain-containing protein [Actinomycetota bacterium]
MLGGSAGRIQPLDLAVARRAATLHVPDPRPERDALIAATALEHHLVVVTRNVSDFSEL